MRALVAAGERVTAVSRHPSDELPEGVRHRRADLTDVESLRPVLEGAGALFLLVPGQGAHPPDVLDAAEAAGVRRVVLRSSQGAGTRPRARSHDPLRAYEDAVRRSGLEWTVLRPGGFASNAFAWAPAIRSERTAAAPFGDVGLPFVDPDDIAEVAAVVLRDDGRVYELTGPVAISPRERARVIGDALGEPVRFVEQSREEARTRMLAFMPEPVVDGTLDILGEPSDAERRVSPDVERILGRPPRDFAEWVARNRAAFA
ncbi:NAD(P)H-binding protein [Streptosporangium sp. NPDC023615]|uniref:NAD(P)H-binding protein n=1 Tax=Streptosporangium sp. NPDC023615 TaxID=3154794 RepID=UPI00342CC271